MDCGNLYHDIPSTLPTELMQRLAGRPGLTIERIVSKGHCSPPGFWYDQPDNEWVMLLQGEAVLRFEQDERRLHMHAGSYVNIAAHERHRVEWTAESTDTIWLAVFY